MIVLENARIFTPEGVKENGFVLIKDERIHSIGSQTELKKSPGARVIDLSGKMVIPGFIDVHIHGVQGHEAMGAALEKVIRVIPRYGVTSFLATTLTLPEDEIERRLKEMAVVLADPPPGAECLGIHIEGPHLSTKRPGMANPEWFQPLTREGFDHLQNLTGGRIRMITFAPEDCDIDTIIPYLKEQKVVPVIGHSDADYEFVMHAVELGLDHATHTYNAMPPFHHRRPGVIGAVLASDDIYAQLIADGHHVHPGAMKVLINAKGVDKTVLISDAVPFAGMQEGEYEWHSYQIVIKDGTIRSPEGVLSGAYSMMDQGFKNLIKLVGLSPEDACLTASYVPAKSIGVDDHKGMLKEGYDADLTVLDEDIRVRMTIGRGKILWDGN